MREIKFRHIKEDGTIEINRLNREQTGGVVEQYTGLKDKNGKEIYEGDIVTDALGKKHTVEWDDEEVRYYFQPVGSTCYHDRVAPETTDYSTMEGRWSVIGNIHENPELLGGEE